VIDPAVVEDPPFITCSFNNVDFPPLHRVRIAILVLDNNEQAKAVFDSTKGPDSQEVSGIGDVASWSNFIATLEFVTGRYDVSVGVPPIDGQGAQAIAEELAGLVASRLE
jgi:hypothetical protein